MDVLVRGMKMPKTCEECEFASWSNLCQTMWCNRIEEPTGEDFSKDYKIKRAEWCPLVEITSPMGYKGFVGSVEWSEKDSVYYGRVLGIRALVSFEGKDRQSLADDFRRAVDDYLAIQ